MEQTVELMLKDHIVDKKALLMRKHDLVGMTREQAMLVLNVLTLEESGAKVTTNRIQKTFAYTKTELEDLIADLMEQDLVKIKMTKNGIEFKFNDL
jgi:predicted transcriptional regulator